MHIAGLSQVIANALVEASGYALVAVGFGLMYQTARFFNFAHGAILAVGAYGAYSCGAGLGCNWLIAALGGVGCAAGVGVAAEGAVFSPMRRTGASATALFLTSLGLLIALQNSLSMVYGDGMMVLSGLPTATGYHLYGVNFSGLQLLRLLVSVVVILAVYAVLRLTRAGKMIRAVSCDSALAEITGLNVRRIVQGVFLLGSALAGLAGVLIAMETSIRPNMGLHVFLMAVVGMVIGGTNRIAGVVCGCVVVAMLRNFALWWFPAQWADGAAFSAMIVFLLVRPRGFLNGNRGKATI